jgi:hypothetical protein
VQRIGANGRREAVTESDRHGPRVASL